ncbi:hypothetical protein PC111_g10635 [Phytophthora cactorum]|nr:hypothetical protein PC111_g10635 [Phytophthora cactorum]KAG3016251.1 hypothetical protein PC120_g11716 [Phytophthora cactorum]
MFLVHLSALLLKRFRIAKRDRRVIIFSALLPVTLLAAGFIILKTSALTRSDVKLALSTEDFEAKVPSVPYFCEADDSQWCSKIMDSLFTGGESSPFTTTDISTPPYTKWPTSVFNVSYAEADLTSSSNPHSNEYCLRISDKIYQRAFGKTDDEMTKVTQTPRMEL